MCYILIGIIIEIKYLGLKNNLKIKIEFSKLLKFNLRQKA